MTITRPVIAGAVVALTGQGLAVGVTMALVTAGGGGPGSDLDAGNTLTVLLAGFFIYGIAQLVLLGVTIGAARRLGPGSSWGLTAGWVIGLAASLFYLLGGLGA